MIKEGARLTALKEFSAQNDGKKGKEKACADGSDLPQRRCGQCSETGYNSRTCKSKVENKVE